MAGFDPNRIPGKSPHLRLASTGATVVALLLGLALATTGLAGQESGPPVPQEFDWWEEEGVRSTAPWGQALDTAATKAMRAWTTAPEYTNRLVDHLPKDAAVVSPADHWGHPPGKPGHLHRVDQFYDYFSALAESSPRVRFDRLGETEEGNRLALVKVGSEENLERLEQVREAYHRIADPRRTTRAEMEELIEDLPVIHAVFTGLHSRETGHPEVAPELAYRLAVSDQPFIRDIRANSVLFLVPVADPDGRNRVVDWYRRHAEGIYDYEERIPSPPYWGKYIRHDNNRDGIQMTLRLTREVVDLFETWKYPLALDLHESFPFIFVSTGYGNRNYDPILRHEWHWMGQYEVTGLTSLGMPGVWATGNFAAWNPSYMVFTANNRNANGRFYETFGNLIPTTVRREVNRAFTSVEWYRANPPSRDVIWSLRNNINYAQSAVLHSLHLGATSREKVLRNYWTKARNSLRKGKTRAPFAYVVPVDQERKADAAHLLNLLRRQGIELHRAREAGSFEGADVRPGDYLVRMDQPYRNFIQMLMGVQDYPESLPDPTDDSAWTLPLMYNVQARSLADSSVLELPMEEVTDEVVVPGDVRAPTGTDADWWIVRYAASAHALQARHELGDVPVFAAREAFDVSGEGRFDRGAWLIPSASMERTRLEAWAEEFGLEAIGVDEEAVEGVARHRQDFPRIALLHTWRHTQEDGSIRYAFDQAGIPYSYLPVDRLPEVDLREEFDVVLFPDQGGGTTGREIFQGLDPDLGPLPYTRTPEYPSLGFPSSSEDITGGMSYEGLEELSGFVEEGGTLLTLGSASNLAIDFGLVRGVSSAGTDDLHSPGAIVRGTVTDRASPVAYGYGDEMPLYARFGPYLSVDDDGDEAAVVRYASGDGLVMSGLVEGEDELADQPAIVTVPRGEGHVVLFGARVLHRHQTQGSFAFAWNAMLNWNDLDRGGPRARSEQVDARGGR